MSSSLGFFASQISGHLFTLTGSYDALATVTVPSGGASSITFSAIPQTGYKHLQIRGIARGTSTLARASLLINGASQTNNHYLGGSGASAFAGGGGSNDCAIIPTSSQLGNTFGAFIIDVLDYANPNKNITFRSLGGMDINGSGGYAIMYSGFWNTLSPATSITLSGGSVGSGNFDQFSQFSLYGIK